LEFVTLKAVTRIGILVAAVATGAVVLSLARPDILSFSGGVIYATCYADGDIDAPARPAIEAKALSFVRAVVGPNPQAAYALMSARGRAETSPAQFAAAAAAISRGPFSPPAISHSFLVMLHFGGTQQSRLRCTSPDGSVLGNAEVVDTGHLQATVLIDTKEAERPATFRVLLAVENGEWVVRGFQFSNDEAVIRRWRS
jgi:hypothetical protein